VVECGPLPPFQKIKKPPAASRCPDSRLSLPDFIKNWFESAKVETATVVFKRDIRQIRAWVSRKIQFPAKIFCRTGDRMSGGWKTMRGVKTGKKTGETGAEFPGLSVWFSRFFQRGGGLYGQTRRLGGPNFLRFPDDQTN
jgi:hypothetical protein